MMNKVKVYTQDKKSRQKVFPYEVVLDNIRSAHNTGSILRNGDAFGCSQFHFLGITPQDSNPKVMKTANNAQQGLKLMYWKDEVELLGYLRKTCRKIYVFETTDQSKPLFDCEFELPCSIVIGHETAGVSGYFIENADQLVSVPMFGKKNSINVSVVSGIIFYEITRQLNLSSK